MESTLSHCGNQARAFDKERFLCALFAAPEEREKLFTLLAFNYEIAKIRGMVTEPMAGLIRLQWWREAIESIYAGKTPNHDIATSLALLIQNHGLNVQHFETLLNTREQDLEEQPPESLEALIRYSEGSNSPLFQLMLEALGINDDAHHEAAKHLGIAWALTGMMRTIKFPGAKRLIFPVDLLQQHSISPDNIAEGKNLEQTYPLVKTLVAATKEHLNRATQLKPKKQAKPIFLTAVFIDTYLHRISKSGYDLFHTDLEGRHVGTQVKLLMKGML